MDSRITKIDLNDWVKSGEGAIGASYNHKDDPTLMLKMNLTDAPLDTWEREISCAEAVYKLGLPTPKPGSIVTDGKNYGLMFQRIPNKISYARATEAHPEDIEKMAASFAAVVKKMHSTVAKVEGVQSVKDFIRDAIDKNVFHDETFKQKARKLVDSLPDGDTAIHGDLHFGNIIMSEGKDYIIDLGNFSYGYFMFDMAMFNNVCNMSEVYPELFVKNFHCKPEDGRSFYQAYINAYFGKEIDLNEFSKELIPYTALRIISMENEIGMPLPEKAEQVARHYIDSL